LLGLTAPDGVFIAGHELEDACDAAGGTKLSAARTAKSNLRTAIEEPRQLVAKARYGVSGANRGLAIKVFGRVLAKGAASSCPHTLTPPTIPSNSALEQPLDTARSAVSEFHSSGALQPKQAGRRSASDIATLKGKLLELGPVDARFGRRARHCFTGSSPR
jgi:hypothetical protein